MGAAKLEPDSGQREAAGAPRQYYGCVYCILIAVPNSSRNPATRGGFCFLEPVMRTRTIKGSEPLIPASRPPSPTASGRTLLHIPVVHTQVEMGSLRPIIEAMTVQKLGAEGWARNIAL